MTHVPLILAALLAFAAPAAAQQKGARTATLVKVDPALALAAAQAMITKADAEHIFTAGAWDYGPTARHERSGMLCQFTMEGAVNAVTVYDPGPNRGQDVGCNAAFGGVLVSHFASRASLVGRFEAVADGAVAAMKMRVGTSQPYTGEVFELKAAGLPTTRTHRLVTEQSGHKIFQRVAVMDMGDWIITQRATAPLEAAPTADRLATLRLALVAKEMQSRNGL